MMKSLTLRPRKVTAICAAAAISLVTLFSPAVVRAQSTCDAASSDCAAGACSCPGCQAFFESSNGSIGSPMAPAPYNFELGTPSASPYTYSPDQIPTTPQVAPPSVPSGSGADFGSSVGNDASLLQQPMTGGSLPTGNLASTIGSVAGGQGIPSMIGDFFGMGLNYVAFPGADTGQGLASGENATIATAGGDRQFKTAENNSPFPTNRFFFNYNHFHNAVVNAVGQSQDLNRYTFGLEQTFYDGNISFELRVPFSGTVTASPSVFDPGRTSATEFGNIAVAAKALLYRERDFAVSVGLGVVLPTGSDFVVESPVQNRFENGAVRVQPFLGVYYAPTSRVFTQFFSQLDFDAGSSDVLIGTQVDQFQMQSLLMLDYSVGYWLKRERCGRGIRALAPMVELHYTTTLEDQEYGVFQGQGIFVEETRRDVLNLTGGLFMQVGDASQIKVAAVSPLRTDADKLFDFEFGLQYVRSF